MTEKAANPPESQLETETSATSDNGSMPDTDPVVAVSLSGGGHRAALFGLGALWALFDIGLARRVALISSVSGGSVTNGYLGANLTYRDQEDASFPVMAGNLASNLAREWSIWRSWAVRLYLLVVATLVIASTAAAVSATSNPWLWPLPAAFVLIVAPAARSIPISAHFRRILSSGDIDHFEDDGLPKSRSDTSHEDATDHVICATSLESGKHLYLSPRFVFSPAYGWARPDGIRWSEAVHASAAMPGPFPLKWLKASHLDFSAVRGAGPRRIPLFDGGVYDNLADQWPIGLADRLKDYETRQPNVQTPQVLVAVNSSASLRPAPRGRYRIPVLGELLALLRAKDIMYNNAATLRIRGLTGLFDRSAQQLEVDDESAPFDKNKAARQLAIRLRENLSEGAFVNLMAETDAGQLGDRLPAGIELPQEHRIEVLTALLELVRKEWTQLDGRHVQESGLPMRGISVEIDDSPFVIIDKYNEILNGLTWPDRAQRALEAKQHLHEHLKHDPASDACRTFWAEIVDKNSRVPTTLSGLGPEVSGRLLYHGYVLTMINLYVILGDELGNLINVPSISDWAARSE